MTKKRNQSDLVALALVVSLSVSVAVPVESAAQEQSYTESPKVSELVMQGNALLDKANTEEAIKKFRTADELADGRSFNALMGLAHALRRSGDLTEATERAHDAIQIAPTAPDRAAASTLVGRCFYLASRRPNTPSLVAKQYRREGAGFLRQALAVAPETSTEALKLFLDVFDEDVESELMRRLLLAYLEREPEGEFVSGAQVGLCWLGATTADETFCEAVVGPIHVGRGVNPPVMISHPQAQYTARTRKERIQGVVIVQSIISETGKMTSVILLKGLHPDLDQATLEAVKRWIFEPATLANGRPMAVYYTTTVNFQLRYSRSRGAVPGAG